jgi:hypothetical protein
MELFQNVVPYCVRRISKNAHIERSSQQKFFVFEKPDSSRLVLPNEVICLQEEPLGLFVSIAKLFGSDRAVEKSGLDMNVNAPCQSTESEVTSEYGRSVKQKIKKE